METRSVPLGMVHVLALLDRGSMLGLLTGRCALGLLLSLNTATLVEELVAVKGQEPMYAPSFVCNIKLQELLVETI